MVLTEKEFLNSVNSLQSADLNERAYLYHVVARIARKDAGYLERRDSLDRNLRTIGKYMLEDMTGFNPELTESLVLGVGYCLASSRFSRNLDVLKLAESIICMPKLSRDILIKSIWSIANVKDVKMYGVLSAKIVPFIGEVLCGEHKSEPPVLKEMIRLVDKALTHIPQVTLEHRALWIKDMIRLMVHRLHYIRENATNILRNHIKNIVTFRNGDIGKIVVRLLFIRTDKDVDIIKDMIQLCANHPQHVIKSWLVLVNLVAKMITKKASYTNEIFSIPKFITEHSREQSTKIMLLQYWPLLIDIMSAQNSEFLLSNTIRIILSPFFRMESSTMEVRCEMVRAWWHLIRTEASLNYVNNYNLILEPCLKLCFDYPSCGETLKLGATILILLMEPSHGEVLPVLSPPPLRFTDEPGADEGPNDEAPSSTFLQRLFFKYFHLLLKSNTCSLDNYIQRIWAHVCGGESGSPSYEEMEDTVAMAMEHLQPFMLSRFLLLANTCRRYIRGPVERGELALRVVQCDVHNTNQFAKFLKSVKDSGDMHHGMLWTIVSKYISVLKDLGKSTEHIFGVWCDLTEFMIDYVADGCYVLNEGSHINPDFKTTTSLLEHLPSLAVKRSPISTGVFQDMLHDACTLWGTLFNIFKEEATNFNIFAEEVSFLISDMCNKYLHTMYIYPLIAISKELIEVTEIPKLTIISKELNPIYSLVNDILGLVFKEERNKTKGDDPSTIILCIEMVSSSWRLVTAGQLIAYLNLIKENLLSLLQSVEKHPISIHNASQKCWIALWEWYVDMTRGICPETCIQSHLMFYGSPEVLCLEHYLIFGLQHSKKLVRTATAKFWNTAFGSNNEITCSEELRAVLQKEAKRIHLVVGTAIEEQFGPSIQSQETNLSSQISNIPSEAPQSNRSKGSFLGRKRPDNSEKAAQSPLPAGSDVSFKGKAKRQIDETSRECVYISSSPKKQKILTKHQKEKYMEQKIERNVPVMYNSLDLNSQEPLIFSTDSQSQAPDKPSEEPATPPASATSGDVNLSKPSPGFTSRLFFLPNSTKATMSKLAAMIPDNSPSTIPDDSARMETPEESEDELFHDPPKSSFQHPKSPIVDPPSSEREPIDDEKAPVSYPRRPGDLAIDQSGDDVIRSATPRNTFLQSEVGSPLNRKEVLKSIVEDVKKMMDRVSPDTSSDMSRSRITTPDETGSMLGTLDNMTTNENLLPDGSYVQVLDTPEDGPKHGIILVEDSQEPTAQLESPGTSGLVAETPQDSCGSAVVTLVLSQDALDNTTLPSTDDFRDKIDSDSCSTQQDSFSTQQDAGKPPDRRCSRRLLSKRSNSEDQMAPVQKKPFKKIRSEEDTSNVIVVNPKAPTKTPSENAPSSEKQRRSMRLRKVSVKLDPQKYEVDSSHKPNRRSDSRNSVEVVEQSSEEKKLLPNKSTESDSNDTEIYSIPDSQEPQSTCSLESHDTADSDKSVRSIPDSQKDKPLPTVPQTSTARTRSRKQSQKKEKCPNAKGLITSYLSQSPKNKENSGIASTPSNSISTTTEISGNNQRSFDDDKATPDETPKETISEPSLRTRSRSRKQANPKKAAGPVKKSMRLAGKTVSNTALTDVESPPDGSLPSSQTIVPDSQEVPSQTTNSGEMVADTLPNEDTPQEVHVVESTPTQGDDGTGGKFCEEVPPAITDDLSFEVSSSIKNTLLGSDKSVESVETFGMDVILPQTYTPEEGLDTPNLSDISYTENLERTQESEVFCGDSPQRHVSVLEPTDMLIFSDITVVPDSQSAFDDEPRPPQEPPKGLQRQLSVFEDLPTVIQNKIKETELARDQVPPTEIGIDLFGAKVEKATESEVKTPPKSPHLEGTSPRTPSSILKKSGTPSSRSPLISRRRVTFGPLPEKHKDPHETTPKRHSTSRAQRKAKFSPRLLNKVPKSHNEEPIYPSLVHCTVHAHDIIKNLCTGYTMSIRALNMSQITMSRNIKTIGDLARLTPSELEHLPFITPKVIQLRRQLKKYEMTQSPTLALKSVFESEMTKKSDLGTLDEESDKGKEKENNMEKGEEVMETKVEVEVKDLSGENKENVPPFSDDSDTIVKIKDDATIQETDKRTTEIEEVKQASDEKDGIKASVFPNKDGEAPETRTDEDDITLLPAPSQDSISNDNNFANVINSLDMVIPNHDSTSVDTDIPTDEDECLEMETDPFVITRSGSIVVENKIVGESLEKEHGSCPEVDAERANGGVMEQSHKIAEHQESTSVGEPELEIEGPTESMETEKTEQLKVPVYTPSTEDLFPHDTFTHEEPPASDSHGSIGSTDSHNSVGSTPSPSKPPMTLPTTQSLSFVDSSVVVDPPATVVTADFPVVADPPAMVDVAPAGEPHDTKVPDTLYAPGRASVTATRTLVDYPLTQNFPAFPVPPDFTEINTADYIASINEFRDKLEQVDALANSEEKSRALKTMEQTLVGTTQLFMSYLRDRATR